MAYKVLYRKYRPDSFEKIVGQENIVNTLKNSIVNNSYAQAYIFTGPRGTGKTSTAKVFAKAINCENNINGEACGKCEQCINFQTNPDIIEIDAASNNGVDEIRELKNNITLAPSTSKFKIYIIDEVHMLSTGAFNALLKTLEEPPSHVIFILATTEIYKVPITILSRCQRFDFKRIDKTTMIDYIKSICKNENIEITENAIEEIYDLSEGCLRDALSILDQTSKSSQEIDETTILKEYNIISNNDIETLINYTNIGKIDELLNILNNFEDSGMNTQKLIKKIIKYLENKAINIKLGKEKKYDYKLIKKLIIDLNKCYIDARINDNTFSMIKLAFMDSANINNINMTQNVKKEQLETPMVDQSKFVVVAGNSIDIRINNCFVEANKEELKKLSEIWKSIDKNKLADIDLSEYNVVAASNKYSIFISQEESLTDLFNIKSETIEKLLKKNNYSGKVVAITQNRWNKEKENYIKKIKVQKYEYIEEPQSKLDEIEKTKNEIESIFTDLPVEIS